MSRDRYGDESIEYERRIVEAALPARPKMHDGNCALGRHKPCDCWSLRVYRALDYLTAAAQSEEE